jgi:hypothetical protein
MSQQNQTTLQSNINSQIADNTSGNISAADIRDNLIDITDSLLFNNGSQSITGSLTITQGFTGSLRGTATTASYVNPLYQSVQITGPTSIIGTLAQGQNTFPNGLSSHTEGNNTTTTGQYSHAEGSDTVAIGQSSHTEGKDTTSNGQYSHAEGFNTISQGTYSHAEGQGTTAAGQSSHTEGQSTISSGSFSHAEGNFTTSQGVASHAEGAFTLSQGIYSHAEGNGTIATGGGSHAEGVFTTSLGSYSHAEGLNTVASGSYQHVQGKYNTQGDNTSLMIVGNGTSVGARKDAFKVRMSGSIILPTTQSSSPSWTGTDGEMIFATVTGNHFFYVWMAGAWRSGSLV